MEIIKPSYEILTEINGEQILKDLEKTARTCYKSENKITEESAHKLIASLIKRGHESQLEHYSISVRFICDRGVSHELVRHRLASFSQESTRYVNYSSNDIQFICPTDLDDVSNIKMNRCNFPLWLLTVHLAEDGYKELIARGVSPQIARSVLPNALKTEVVMTANLREWRHIFNMRCTSSAHPQMRELMLPLLKEMSDKIPVIFDDLKDKYYV